MNLEDKLNNLPAPKSTDFYITHQKEIAQAMTELKQKTPLDLLSGDTVVDAIHQMVDGVQEQLDFKSKIQCGKQECSFCCHSEIFISKLEADYIRDNAEYEINEERLYKQRQTKSYNDLSFADKACIMLKDGKCQVYAHRPVLCRNHAALAGTDPQQCHQQNIKQGTVCVDQPRAPLLEAMNLYITTRDVKSIDDVRNIAEFNWSKPITLP